MVIKQAAVLQLPPYFYGKLRAASRAFHDQRTGANLIAFTSCRVPANRQEEPLLPLLTGDSTSILGGKQCI